jgi:hypothetical protein
MFAGNLEVEGGITATGEVQSPTIEALLAQIADLQSQLSALQVGNRMETRIYEYEANLLSNTDTNFTLSEITNGDLDDNQSAFIRILNVSDVSTLDIDFNLQFVRSYLGEQVYEDWFGTIYSLGNNQPLYSAQNYLATYNGIFDHAFRAQNTDFSGTLILAITAQFPSDSDIQLQNTNAKKQNLIKE